MPARRAHPQYALAGAALSIFALLPSIAWIFTDSLVWPWDQAWYGEVAADLWYLLGSSPREWMRGMLYLLGQKPPLVSWLGQFLVPFGLMTGNVEAALLLLCVASNTVTLFLLWLYARRAAPDRPLIAVLAVTACASMPLFAGMGHQFVTEPLQTLIITASFVTAAFADRVRLPRLVITLVLLGFGGIAVKTTSPAYNGLALLLIAYIALRRWRGGEILLKLNRADATLTAAAAALAAATVAWYVVNLEGMMQHVRNVMDSGIALQYGSAASLPAKAAFWFKALGGGVSVLPAAGLAIMGAASLIVAARAPAVWRSRNLPGIAAVMALLHSAAVLFQFMFQIIEETRFIASLMPMMVIVLVFALSQVRLVWAEHALLVCFAAQLVVVNMLAAGRIDAASPTVWLKPLDAGSAGRQTAQEIISKSCSADKAYQYVIVGIEEPDMNANSLAFEAAKERNKTGFRCYYTGLGYAAADLQPVLERVESLNPAFIVDAMRRSALAASPNFLNKMAAPFAESMSRSNRYRPLRESVNGFILYERQD